MPAQVRIQLGQGGAFSITRDMLVKEGVGSFYKVHLPQHVLASEKSLSKCHLSANIMRLCGPVIIKYSMFSPLNSRNSWYFRVSLPAFFAKPPTRLLDLAASGMLFLRRNRVVNVLAMPHDL